MWIPNTPALGWVRELRDKAAAAGTAFFFKQWGGPFGKAGGRLLDGREWSEYPEPAIARV
jgi:protein gp37